MMAFNKPVFKIEVLTPDDDIRHTIEKHAWNIDFRQTLTENIGTFSFNLPVKRVDESYKYRDIGLFDKVKIYLGWGTVPSTPLFIGRVMQIQGAMSTATGTVRVIKGMDEGEILLRRLKGMDDFVAENASDIATEFANDLSLGTGEIETDTTDETHRIDIDRYERYFDMVKKVSEYWYDAITKVNKDFRVWNGNLIWKSRPIRTLNARFTIGKNIISYVIVRDLNTVKNTIYVYGKRGKPHDATKDDGTDMATPDQGNTTVDAASASGQKVLNVTATAAFSVDDDVIISDWSSRYEKNTVDTIQAGVSLTMDNNLTNTYQNGDTVFVYPGWIAGYANNTLGTDAANYKVGSRSITTTAVGASHTGLGYAPSSNFNLNYYPRINFYACSTTDANSVIVRLWDINLYTAIYEIGRMDPDGNKFIFFQLPAGRDNANSWVLSNSGFDWANVFLIDWTGESVANGDLLIDGLFLDNRRYGGSATDATSVAAYGTREMWVVDENLNSDTVCDGRAETLLFQLKDPVIRCDLETRGNRKVDVGDRVPLTIPAESLSAENFDVVTIQQKMNGDQWRTYYTMLNTALTRHAPEISLREFLIKKFWEQRETDRGINIVK